MLFHYSIALIAFLLCIGVVYNQVGWNNIKNCYAMWLTKDYWTTYNIVEAISWLCKAAIIFPGLLFNITIWQLYIVSLITSCTLIWASNKKLLPTLVGFNTLWVLISVIMITQHFIKV